MTEFHTMADVIREVETVAGLSASPRRQVLLEKAAELLKEQQGSPPYRGSLYLARDGWWNDPEAFQHDLIGKGRFQLPEVGKPFTLTNGRDFFGTEDVEVVVGHPPHVTFSTPQATYWLEVDPA